MRHFPGRNLLAVSMTLLLGCSPTKPQPAPNSRQTAAVDTLYFPPPRDAVEVSPGLFAATVFGSWNTHLGEKRPGTPANVLRITEGASYGFTVIFFPTPKFQGGEITYREIFTLPQAPSGWGDLSDEDVPEAVRPRSTVSADGRVHTYEQTFNMKPGQVIPTYAEGESLFIMFPYPIHNWELALDDPPGMWRLQAFINGRPLGDVTFQVETGSVRHFE